MAIKSINKSDVQRITSGQVIVDLVSIVKELVENAIDSGANKIEILFKNNGLESIEVIDDGSGIDKEDFKNICMKHCTSKLSSYEDLHGVNTLGFRGEALSSLSAISNVKIITCTKKDLPRASELEFNSMGHLISEKKKIGGNKGTTVCIKDIFYNLPVRAKNLQNNIKREFSKVMTFLTNYLIIYPNIRFSIYNVNKNNRKNLILGTIGTKKATILDNLVTIFGSNGSYGFVPVEIEVNDIEAKFKLANGVYPTLKTLNIKFEGYISNSSFGMGRSSADRQFLYINKRPIVLKKFLKTINEVYKTFNHTQIPAVILNINIEPEFLDVNVTPDKRTVLIHNEDLINELLRNELTKFYDSQGNTIPKNHQKEISFISNDNKSNIKTIQTNFKELRQNQLVLEKISQSKNTYPESKAIEVNEKVDKVDEKVDENAKDNFDVEDTKEKEEHEHEHEHKNVTANTNVEESEIYQDKIDLNATNSKFEKVNKSRDKISKNTMEYNAKTSDISKNIVKLIDATENNHPNDTKKTESSNNSDIIKSYHEDLFSSNNAQFTSSLSTTNETCLEPINDSSKHVSKNNETTDKLFVDEIGYDFESNEYQKSPDKDKNYSLKITIGDDSFEERLPKRAKISTPAKKARTSYNKQNLSKSEVHCLSSFMNIRLSNINPNLLTSHLLDSKKSSSKPKVDSISSKDAEEKLSYIISKSDFLKMKVIGQFNLGFILVTLNSSNNLFILDQHASDEKFNFEKLTKSTDFQSQPLVLPKTIELNVMDEIAVYENIDVFKRNGFNIRFDEESLPGQRIKLLALPMSKNTIFDINDFHELIHLVNTNTSLSNRFVKCSKIRSILAMRACRSSIMIGQHLNRKAMQNVVTNLHTLEKPWNCPHGRPTMRHLIELKDWPTNNFDYEL